MAAGAEPRASNHFRFRCGVLRPLAGRSPRRKGHPLRKCAVLRMRNCVYGLRAGITPLQRLLSPKDWPTGQWRRALRLLRKP